MREDANRHVTSGSIGSRSRVRTREDTDISLAKIASHAGHADTFRHLLAMRHARAKSRTEAKIHALPDRTKFSRVNSNLNNRGPRQHFRGDRKEHAIPRRGIPRPH